MNKIMLLTLFAVFLTLRAQAQVLWDKATYGMTVEQVSKLFPAAIKPKDPGELGTADKAKELLRIEETTIVNEKFQVEFYFGNDAKLRQVTIGLKKCESWHSATLIYENISDALRAKYGQEVSAKEDKIGLLNQIEATWIADKTNITVAIFGVGNEGIVFNINYQVRVVRESEKL